MNRKLFELALDETRSSDWEYFEELSSGFLASEFTSLRTMASPGGDGGRDSELFSSDGSTYVAIQYSVAKDFDPKVMRTIKRLEENFDKIRVLIYCTNQQIGAKGDALKQKCIGKGISLDIRDKSWFLERYELDDNKYSCASHLVDIIARPLLESESIIEKSRPALTSIESKVALTYLGMQWEDENTDKGLTKIAFESLVRAALRNTSSESRMARIEVHKKVIEFIPSSDPGEIEQYVNSALNKLNKKVIRHWTKGDEFCLTHEEVSRIQERVAETACEEVDFSNEVERLVGNEREDSDHINDENIQEITNRILRIIDNYLIKSGELFASSVLRGDILLSDRNTLNNCIFSDINNFPSSESYLVHFPDIALNVIARLLSSDLSAVKTHLKKISDTYTLYSFLRETPDVQKVTKKIFSHGKIWLDTTIVLPLLVETFYRDEKNKKYSDIVRSLIESGIELCVTDGVVREVLQHINISLTCSKRSLIQWNGRIPFLYYHYVEQGYEPLKFASSIEIFHGRYRPEDDIAEYLKHNFSIVVVPLADAIQFVDEQIRFRIETLWSEAHKHRRNEGGNGNFDDAITDALIKHDVESYVGVIGMRKNEKVSELGYKHWWLTIDSLAWKIRNKLKEELECPPSSPLMSLDFLANSLSFGPSRKNFSRDQEQLLPLFFETDASEYMPRELIEIANKVREKNEGQPEHVIRRKVRDTCDRMKRRYGKVTQVAVDSEQGAANG
ncbi:hypothetical protein [Marinobacter psychrophilus]|uniref:hypothetical protein n=1 Tax=Marinobacter psychrophilus TaxID=330734 RepID=UPI001B7A019D|nr:hypothetical protein [Marinobacter psychrophilus]MBQ0762224.1 hypothetical protein [Marinobacter psychrophilus]